jgi:hypothetical protein
VSLPVLAFIVAAMIGCVCGRIKEAKGMERFGVVSAESTVMQYGIFRIFGECDTWTHLPI